VELSLFPTPPAVSVEALVEGCVWRLLASADSRSLLFTKAGSPGTAMTWTHTYHQYCIDKLLLVTVCPLPLAFGYEVDANLPTCKNPSWVRVSRAVAKHYFNLPPILITPLQRRCKGSNGMHLWHHLSALLITCCNRQSTHAPRSLVASSTGQGKQSQTSYTVCGIDHTRMPWLASFYLVQQWLVLVWSCT
jgi:hypothetical protein